MRLDYKALKAAHKTLARRLARLDSDLAALTPGAARGSFIRAEISALTLVTALLKACMKKARSK